MPRAGLSQTYYTDYLIHPADTTNSTKNKTVFIQYEADVLSYNAERDKDARCFTGNVKFRHGNATMYCDTAYLKEKDQSFEAFGNVRMLQGDTVEIYSDYLQYNGMTRLARLRYNVKMKTPSTSVFTDSLDYDRVTDIAYYFTGGTVIEQQNTLTSIYGQFQPSTNDAEFRDSVVLYNDSTRLTTEHFFYNTASRIGRFSGNSRIEADSGLILSQRGVYDLNQDVGILLDRSELYSGSRKLVGDSIYFDGDGHIGEAFGDMELIDTLQKTNLYGDYGFFDNTRNYAFATSKAYAVDYSQKDSLFFGADTLELLSFALPDSILLNKANMGSDSLRREVRAYHNVRLYRQDVQAISDSLTYTSLDSILVLYSNPIIWQEQRQLLGDTISFQFKEEKLDYVDVISNGLCVEKVLEFENKYNQISGSRMRAWVQDTVLRAIKVKKPVELVTFMKDENTGKFKGMVRLKSGDMDVEMDSRGYVKKTKWIEKPDGKFYPMKKTNDEQVAKLDNFRWEVDKRPKTPKDVIGKAYDLSEDKTNKLLALKAMSGAKAAMIAYDAYEKDQERLRQLRAEALKKLLDENKDKDYNYQYVLRDKREIIPDDISKYVNTQWHCNPFSDKGKLDASNTSPFTLMREKKISIEEYKASKQNLSSQEKSKENSTMKSSAQELKTTTP